MSDAYLIPAMAAGDAAGLPLSVQQLADAIADGLWLWQVRTGEHYRSPQCCRLLGLHARWETVARQHWLDLVHAEDRPQAQAELQQCLQQGKTTYAADFRLRGGNGRWKWIAARCRAMSRGHCNCCWCCAISMVSDSCKMPIGPASRPFPPGWSNARTPLPLSAVRRSRCISMSTRPTA